MRKAETRHRESSQREAMRAVIAVLEHSAAANLHNEANDIRRGQVGSGMRGDKRRTYRFQDDSVVDHVTGKSARCGDVMKGGFDRLW